MSILSVLGKGGYFMIAIVLGSLVAIGVLIERYLVIRRARSRTETVSAGIIDSVRKGRMEEAKDRCRLSRTPVARVLLSGLDVHPALDAMRESVAMAGQVELDNLEKRMGWLSLIAAAAPMVGFLGTVTGMIRAFMQVQAHSGQVDASVLAGGIWEALVTTAAGLAVGILALIGHNWLAGQIEELTHQLRRASFDLLRLSAASEKEYVSL